MNADTPFLNHRDLGFFVLVGRIFDRGNPEA